MMVGGGPSPITHSPFLPIGVASSYTSSSMTSTTTCNNNSNNITHNNTTISTTLGQPYNSDNCSYGPMYSSYNTSNYGSISGGTMKTPRSVTPYARTSPCSNYSSNNVTTAMGTVPSAMSLQPQAGIYPPPPVSTDSHHNIYRAGTQSAVVVATAFQDYNSQK